MKHKTTAHLHTEAVGRNVFAQQSGKINTHRLKRHFKFKTAVCSGPRSNQIRSAERRAMKTVGSEEHHETWAAQRRRRADFSSRTRAAGYPITRYGLLRRWHRHARTDKRHRRQQWYRVARPIPRRSDEHRVRLCMYRVQGTGRPNMTYFTCTQYPSKSKDTGAPWALSA